MSAHSRQAPTRLPIEVRGSVDLPLGMPAADFLRDYWQQHPLLIRGAFAGFHLPLQPDDLAGLACEESVLARLVQHNSEGDAWEVRNGPFDDADFAALPERDWTLLVQDVDKWDSDVAALLDHFDFLPAWRIDDIMVSYAEDRGGVGPHVDQYDVFLLQGLGQRRWSIDVSTDMNPDFRDDAELKVLRSFRATHNWTLAPGDMLYLPPGVPHDGVAEGAAMTFSIGMRAPAGSELLLDYVEQLAADMPDTLRYRDPQPMPCGQPGEITEAALAQVHRALGPVAHDADPQSLHIWFGCFITAYRSAQLAAAPDHETDDPQLIRALEHGAMLLRHPWSRMAWSSHSNETRLFVAGATYVCPRDLATRLCSQRYLDFSTLPGPTDRATLLQLINAGHLLISAEGAHVDG